MNNRVFVFCIGGTGIRVMKSITMLLAAGMDAHGFEVVPVIIDPHDGLEEKRNVQTLIEEYQSIYKELVLGDGKRLNATQEFFGTALPDLATLSGLQNDVVVPSSEKKTFSQYVNYGNIGSTDLNKYLIQTLFSQKNLDNSLDVGFKGNPNVGTVVLDEMISGADWYQNVCNLCQKGDRIFIISSIFGGTGASGFPLLEKKLHQEKNNQVVAQAMMGAVSVLPYFALQDPATTDSDIDSTNFLTKTKSALAYYEHNVKPDFLYYVGEQGMKATYENNEAIQNDKAHFVELVAATALFDFLTKEVKPEVPQALSRSIRENAESLTFAEVGDAYADVVKAVTDMTLLARLVNILPYESQFPLSKDRNFTPAFYEDQAYTKLCNFIDRFQEWYQELSSNQRSFAPLTIAPDGPTVNLRNWVTGFTLDAKDESYYLLEMIRASNHDTDSSHNVPLRRFLSYAYSAINKYTQKIES
jgi:hypothetical protein